MFIWSHSKWCIFSQCREKYRFRYLLHTQEPKNEFSQRGTDLHAAIERHLKGEGPRPVEHPFLIAESGQIGQSEVTIWLDREWKPCLPDDPNRWFIAKLDWLRITDHRARGIDWKTGKVYPDHAEQAELYALAVLCEHPEVVEVTMIHAYLDTGREATRVFGPSNLGRLKEKWLPRAQEMEQATDFFPNPTYLCRYCGFSKLKGGPCAF